MSKEIITSRQATSMIVMYLLGSSLVLGISKESVQDAWIAFLVAMAAIMPIVYIYARLLRRCPGRDIFDICFDLFGPVFGRVLTVVFALYAFHLGSLVMRNFSSFIQVTAFDQMPQTVSMILVIVIIIWATRGGIETLGRWSSVALPIILFIVLMTILLLAKDMHLTSLLPVGEHLDAVPKDAWADFSFPLAETVLFLGVMNAVKPEDKPGRAWVFALLIGGFTLLIGSYFRNTMVLGWPLHSVINFPSYEAVSVIIAGTFVSRIENVIGANLMMAGFIKISICLLVASKGFAKTLGSEDYRPYVGPLGLLMVALGSIVYTNIIQMFDFIRVYPYYAFPFQIAIPILLCIAAEIRYLIKTRRENKEAA